ncbi:ftsK/SpoIIIE family protein [Clostridioides difficile CD160]|nr:ftsK/SpoIIIE family protein [Clostridioides difficile CD160]
MSMQSKVSKSAIDDRKIERNNLYAADKEPRLDDFDSDESSLGDLNWDEGLDFSEHNMSNNISDDWMSSLQQQTSPASSEEKIFDTFVIFFKSFFDFLKDFVTSFNDLKLLTIVKTGRTIVITSIITAAIGAIGLIFGKTKGLDLILSGLFSAGIGVPLFYISYLNIKNTTEDKSTINEEISEADSSYTLEEEDEDDEDYFFDEEEDAYSDILTDNENIQNNMAFILENLRTNMLNGMIPRKFLYDSISNCLPYINPNFNDVKKFDEDDDEFLAWDVIIENSAKIIGGRNQEIEKMYLVELEEKLFYISLSIKRPRWLKNEDSLVKEIVNIYAFDNDKGVLDENIYGLGVTVGDIIKIKIMKGAFTKVSLRDTYKLAENYVLDSENYLPVIFGIDMEGEVVCKDLKHMDSLLISGTPRTGKTSLALSILSQIAFFLPPSEAEFHICDPKDKLSDYNSFKIPHVKRFVSSPEDILKELRYVVKVEGSKRQELIGSAGYVNIWDYKKKNPDIHMPLLYVVIDEVITLAETMDKDTKSEFQGLLSELVTRLPATGIRIIMMPHIIKNEIISKTVTDNIPCRISVMGSPEHIERTTGDRKFRERLKNKGELAVKFFNEKTKFVHGILLTPSNEELAEFFQFLNKFWLKQEPNSNKNNSLIESSNEIKSSKEKKEIFDDDEFSIWKEI